MITDKPIDMSGPCLRAFASISRDWALSEKEQRELLGGPTPRTLAEWLRAARMRERMRVPDAVLIRVQLLLQIRCAIKKPMPDAHDQTAWLRCPNREFGGRRPIEEMVGSSHGMARVRDVTAGWSIDTSARRARAIMTELARRSTLTAHQRIAETAERARIRAC
jgi:hypothetical protein